MGQCNSGAYNERAKYLCKVVSDSGDHFLEIRGDRYYIEPDIHPAPYLNDSFSLEFDFYYTSPTKSVIVGFSMQEEHNCQLISVAMGIFHNKNYTLQVYGYTPKYYKYDVPYPRPFNHSVWHHYAISYRQREIKYYIDQYCIYTIQDCHCSPYGFTIGTNGPVKYKNFRLATGKEINPFRKILSGEKLVTHAINFDVSKSTIKPESMGFISQLAQFLKENPSVQLEIDGHTDSDGDSIANMNLSIARANEVRWMLITDGVDGGRLIAKGFGATKPIQPNTTAEGKAENRRVEFMKL